MKMRIKEVEEMLKKVDDKVEEKLWEARMNEELGDLINEKVKLEIEKYKLSH